MCKASQQRTNELLSVLQQFVRYPPLAAFRLCYHPPEAMAVAGRMSEALLEAVRGLHVADPDLGVKPLLAKLREQQPDLGAGNKEVREALIAVKAELTTIVSA